MINKVVKSIGGTIPMHMKISAVYNYRNLGDVDLRNWIQSIADISIQFDKRHLFISRNTTDESCMPTILTHKAFEMKMKEYVFIGQVIGLALRLNTFISTKFADFIYEILLGNTVDLSSFVLKEFDCIFKDIKNMVKSAYYKDLKKHVELSAMDYDNDEWKFTTITLIEKELFLDINTSKDAYNQYEKALIDKISHYLIGGVKLMKKGLLEIIDQNQLSKIKNASEFKNMIYKESTINIEEWKQQTVVSANSEKAKQTVALFWNYIESIDESAQKKILYFWTGYTNLTPQIASIESPTLKLLIKDSVGNDGDASKNHLQVDKCFNELQLPFCGNIDEIRIYFAIDIFESSLFK
ncbi:E3 ubiquitin-protein ligase TOM1-like [Astathelohania contejeani]|uniref:HECT-type E3 ubiquitin transferase n=1 Tax=Astathelohania contejeani TaxID=164912 RepID=A0ABQ7HV84_9MICR|nr:E3 ubiquitin-protein ligase TOM1-like [Thelohania contejeani]